MFAKVLGAEMGGDGEPVRLDVQDNGLVRVDQVKKFRI